MTRPKGRERAAPRGRKGTDKAENEVIEGR